MDIDFITNTYESTNGEVSGFEITLGNNPLGVTGNRALLNRFEITLMTKRRQFMLGDRFIVDSYGGDASKFINKPVVLSDTQSIAASLATAVEQTVQSMLMDDQHINIPDTEKIISAEVLKIDNINDVIVASIKVNPVQVESYDSLIFNLPITRG